MPALLDVIHHAVRRLRRSPGYSWPVLASLSLGIGLNTSIFVVMEDVLRRPLPYADEGRLITAGQLPKRDTAAGAAVPAVRWQMYGTRDLKAWRDSSRTLQYIAVFSEDFGAVSGPDGAEFLRGGTGSPELLRVLGVQPALGRWFAADDAPNSVVLSHELWQRQYGGDTRVVGQTLRMPRGPYTIIGVMAAGVGLPLNAEYWVPSQGMFGEQVVARPRAGVPLQQVALELSALAPSVGRGVTERIVVMPLREQLFGSARPALRLLTGAAALLLLIACANIANLSLSRTLERQREFAVRLTLGASRNSLVSLVLAENLLLSLAGAALGVLVAIWGTRLAIALGPADIARLPDVGIDAIAVAFAALVAVLAALLVSVAPVLTATYRGVQPLLSQAGTRVVRNRVSTRMRYALVTTQLAIALLLITGAGLLIRSVRQLTRGDHLGFSPEGVVIASVPLYGAEYRDPVRREQFMQQLRDRAAAMPGVSSVAFGPPPLVGGRGEGLREGFNMIFSHTDTTQAERPSTTVFVKHIDVGYLETYRIRVRAGRAFLASDHATAPRVAIVSASAARLFFGDRDPVGQTVGPMRRGGEPSLVVGVVDDVLQRDLAMEANPEIFLPLAQQMTDPLPTVAVRVAGPTAPVMAALRQSLRDIDPTLAASRLQPMKEVVDASLQRHAFLLLLLGVFAGLGLLLSAFGLYAVISYLVTQRTLEIGIRMALGAQRIDVVGLVLREGALLTVIGLAIGIPAALVLSRLLRSFLFEVQPHDVVTFASAPIGLALIALIAAFVPARRAAAVDPARAMRAD